MGDQYDSIRKEIEELEDEFDSRLFCKDPDGVRKYLNEYFYDKTVDIHGSGWSYTADESTEMAYNQAKYQVPVDVVYSAKRYESINVINESLVITTKFHETYAAARNPQELARKAGTLTMDPNALLDYRTNQKTPLGPGPGEMSSPPNPYRARTSRVWVKIDGKWKIALMQATRVGERIRDSLRSPKDT